MLKRRTRRETYANGFEYSKTASMDDNNPIMEQGFVCDIDPIEFASLKGTFQTEHTDAADFRCQGDRIPAHVPRLH